MFQYRLPDVVRSGANYRIKFKENIMEIIKQMSQNDIDFKSELEILINKHSQENKSDTPDFILRDYILRCLTTWKLTIRERDRWYNERQKDLLEDKIESE
jgi:hypothetical protein